MHNSSVCLSNMCLFFGIFYDSKYILMQCATRVLCYLLYSLILPFWKLHLFQVLIMQAKQKLVSKQVCLCMHGFWVFMTRFKFNHIVTLLLFICCLSFEIQHRNFFSFHSVFVYFYDCFELFTPNRTSKSWCHRDSFIDSFLQRLLFILEFFAFSCKKSAISYAFSSNIFFAHSLLVKQITF